MKKVNTHALFLGPKSENHEFFKKTLNFLMDEHIHWRRDFQPEDEDMITLRDQHEEDFQKILEKTQKTLFTLSSKLKTASMPWFSLRYQGHMTSDTLMAANLAYMATILYNPNNVAYEGSPATTPLEIDVGKELAQLCGYSPDKAWGHVTADGTIANYEGLWIARNVKSFPLAVKNTPEVEYFVKGYTYFELLNLTVQKILDIVDEVIKEEKKIPGILKKVRSNSVEGKGMERGMLGKLLVPQSKHYSWPKAVDILGIGQENMVNIQVSDNFRMDISDLDTKIENLIKDEKPILGVVAVVGTTEEGAVDEVHEIVKLREKYEKEGVSFYLHVDAAYGGYGRAVFLDEHHTFMELEQLGETLVDRSITETRFADWSEGSHPDWTSGDVHDAYKAMPHADSITIDPHKMGYIPYAAGGIVLRDKRVLNLISYFAAYVFEPDDPDLLGSYIMEGSKPGASAAAVWTAHQVVPLTIDGYGEIIAQSIAGAARFYSSLSEAHPIVVKERKFKVVPLTRPDLNIVDFAFNEVGNTDLAKMNELNENIYAHCSYEKGSAKKGKPVNATDFITSKTTLSQDDYGNAPVTFLGKIGIPRSQWEEVKCVYVLRSCVLTPYLKNIKAYKEYWRMFMDTMKDILELVCAGQ